MDNEIFYRPTKAIINLEAIRENVKSLRKYLRKETSIIAVVKADGYGHGDVESARTALEAGATMVSVATPDEAVRLRKYGISGDILVMAPSPVAFAKTAAALGITLAVSGVDWLVAIQREEFDRPLKVHMKIDSGMGRTGLRDIKTFCSILEVVEQSEQIILDGVFTHFSSADDGERRGTEEQYERFKEFVDLFPEKPRLVHASNSAATFLYPEYEFDAVRFGIGMYGIPPSEYVSERLPFQLKQSLSIESELVHVKQLEEDSPISYGGTYKTTEAEWIGTIPMGYADGLRRGLKRARCTYRR